MKSSKDEPKSPGYVLRLFVVGDELHSRAARQNLKKLCAAHADGSCKIETVDVLKSFQLALDNNIFLTPALMMLSPGPAVTIFGDLSDTDEVLSALGWKGES